MMWWKLLPYVAAVAGVAAILGATYAKGRMDCASSNEINNLRTFANKEKKHDENTKTIIRLPAPELRARYCEWVRDDKSKCLQADIPLP